MGVAWRIDEKKFVVALNHTIQPSTDGVCWDIRLASRYGMVRAQGCDGHSLFQGTVHTLFSQVLRDCDFEEIGTLPGC